VFESLSERFSATFDRLTRKGVLTETDVAASMQDIRTALLEADVSLPIVKSFIRTVQRRATGQNVLHSVTPGQLVIKIVHDELVKMLTGNHTDGELKIDNPPAVVMMVGLQGSGKTTTTAKLARRLQELHGKRVLMASLDTRRPAAMEQLAVLGGQAGIDTLPITPDLAPVVIAERATHMAHQSGHDVVILDTAGRLHVNDDHMGEAREIQEVVKPRETLMVVDGLTGQDAVRIAQDFDSELGITGIILTRMDGDGRGGVALSMKAVTGKTIRFIGTGEKIADLDRFDPERIAGRILGMGDVVALVEKATETFEQEKSERAMKRWMAGRMNFNDLKSQLESLGKMGGITSVARMIPGIGTKLTSAMQQLDDVGFGRELALINSMTRKERANPHIINASRRKRIARGAGLDIKDLNRLLKFHRSMSDTGKKVGRMGLPPQALMPGDPDSMQHLTGNLQGNGKGMHQLAATLKAQRRP